MDKSLYDDVVLYLRKGAYRPALALTRRRLIRKAAHRYSIYGRRLRQGSLVVLHEGEVFDVLRSLHLRKLHLRGPEFLRTVRKTYVVPQGKVLCFEVVRCCDHCSGTYTHTRESGSLFSPGSLFCPTAKGALPENWNPLCPRRRSHQCPRARPFEVPPPYGRSGWTLELFLCRLFVRSVGDM